MLALVFKFSKGQFRTFEEEAAALWNRETAQELMDMYPTHMKALDVTLEQATKFVQTVRDYALAYQIDGQRETFKLAVISLSLGAHFPHDPRFEQGIAYSLSQPDIPQDRRLVRFSDFVEAWLSASWTEEGLDTIGARLVERIALPLSLEDTLYGLVAQSPSIATLPRRQAFLHGCMSHAEGYGLREPQRRLAYVGAALIHGFYWFDDPLMATLRQIVECAETPDLLRDQMTAFYAGFA